MRMLIMLALMIGVVAPAKSAVVYSETAFSDLFACSSLSCGAGSRSFASFAVNETTVLTGADIGTAAYYMANLSGFSISLWNATLTTQLFSVGRTAQDFSLVAGSTSFMNAFYSTSLPSWQIGPGTYYLSAYDTGIFNWRAYPSGNDIALYQGVARGVTLGLNLYGTSGASAVPTPGPIGLLALAVCMLVTRMQRMRRAIVMPAFAG